MILQFVEPGLHSRAGVRAAIIIFVGHGAFMAAADQKIEPRQDFERAMHRHRQPEHRQRQRHQDLRASHNHILTIG